MENLDLSTYTVKGLQKMAKDAGLSGMAKAKRDELNSALAGVDLSLLDLDSYAKMKPVEGKKASKTKVLRKPSSRRRSVSGRNFGRR